MVTKASNADRASEPAISPSLLRRLNAGTAVLSRAELLTAIVATRRAIAVAGTHGKTTTSSMLALILVEAGLRPSFIVGGELNEIGTGAVWDDGEWLAVEADESDGTFLQIAPEVALVTNIEPDHIEHYGSFEALIGAFETFLTEASGPRIVCADDPVAARLGAQVGAISYGVSRAATYRMVDVDSRDHAPGLGGKGQQRQRVRPARDGTADRSPRRRKGATAQ